MKNMTIMHRKYCNITATTITVTITTITVGMTADSAVMPTVIVALSAHHALSPAVIDSDIPYSAKFSRAVNFADFANSNSIAKIIFVKITIIDLLRPKLILTTNVACVV